MMASTWGSPEFPGRRIGWAFTVMNFPAARSIAIPATGNMVQQLEWYMRQATRRLY